MLLTTPMIAMITRMLKMWANQIKIKKEGMIMKIVIALKKQLLKFLNRNNNISNSNNNFQSLHQSNWVLRIFQVLHFILQSRSQRHNLLNNQTQLISLDQLIVLALLLHLNSLELTRRNKVNNWKVKIQMMTIR